MDKIRRFFFSGKSFKKEKPCMKELVDEWIKKAGRNFKQITADTAEIARFTRRRKKAKIS